MMVAGSQAYAGAKVSITVGSPHGVQNHEGWKKIFEASHPNFDVKFVYQPNDLETNQKLFAAVAAGNPPDVTFVDGPEVVSWAERGILEPLDDLVKETGVKREDFILPTWDETIYKGKKWSMAAASGSQFIMFWNKAVFQEAGLDPERYPRTIAEMDSMSDKITKYDASGKLVRIGLIPWKVYGNANSIFTWGWIFGGDFYNTQTQKVTANDPNIVKTLEWMVSYAKKYDITKIGALRAGFGSAEQKPFYVGQLGFEFYGEWEVPQIKRYAPNLKYGYNYIPGPTKPYEDGWIGDWNIGLPKGTKQKKEGWEYIRWFTATPEGTSAYTQVAGVFPAYKKSAYWQSEHLKEPVYKIFVDQLWKQTKNRPIMPAQAFYMGELDREVDNALFGRKAPKQALDDITVSVQKELDSILKGSK
jgi:ABC-type glycerol-3-phosphate transport system substrate-binding protein